VKKKEKGGGGEGEKVGKERGEGGRAMWPDCIRKDLSYKKKRKRERRGGRGEMGGGRTSSFGSESRPRTGASGPLGRFTICSGRLVSQEGKKGKKGRGERRKRGKEKKRGTEVVVERVESGSARP